VISLTGFVAGTSLLLAVFHFSFLTRTTFLIKQAYYRLVRLSGISYCGFLVSDSVLQIQLYNRTV